MFVPLLVLKNALRHRLRTILTVLGIVVAIAAFGLLRTLVDAWYAGANASSSARLVTRNSVSLVFPLPISYAGKLRQVSGVTGVAWANWFGGVYVSERNFFPQFAISGASYLDLYPEFVLPEAARHAFLADRQGAIAGRKLADKFGWKVGDQIPLRGTIYPGTWTFNLRGIYDGAETSTDTSSFFFHYAYLNETFKQRYGRSMDSVGLYIESLEDPSAAATVSQTIDAMFRNSYAETLTETEKAFQLGFVAMSDAIIGAIQAVSYIVIVIIMAVMANTMAMTARERYAEYATLKALGFGGGFVALLIVLESAAIALAGGALGVLATFPLARAFASTIGSLITGFEVSRETIALQLAAALAVGMIAAAIPAWRAARLRIVDGLRAIG
ncbi:MAG TPA: FtsX-like permease family protein [Casimicrobiaceae bacterium]|nr:FtsX-like permease family protein [Casimicrobiaceae bacterium]